MRVGSGNVITGTGKNSAAAPGGAVDGGTLEQACQPPSGTGNQRSWTPSRPSANRITNAGIVVKSQAGAFWYSDPTPDLNNEWSGKTTSFADAAPCNTAVNCVGIMTTGVVYTGTSDPIGTNNFDLLSVVIHEVGHALGLDRGYAAYVAESDDNDVDLIGPRLFAGANIFDLGVSNAHLDPAQGNLVNSLMQPLVNTATAACLPLQTSSRIARSAASSTAARWRAFPNPHPRKCCSPRPSLSSGCGAASPASNVPRKNFPSQARQVRAPI
ncbi:MAG: hypothetical protein JWP63_4965 [Candidatus Solibacter sp.]|nr:hypothetical protein [Candidatus Solibacter sp.]